MTNGRLAGTGVLNQALPAADPTFGVSCSTLLAVKDALLLAVQPVPSPPKPDTVTAPPPATGPATMSVP